MRKRDLEKYEKMLLEKRAKLLKEIGDIKDASLNTTIKEGTGDLSAYSYHMADLGTDAMEREKAFHFASKSGRLVYHIDEALRRIGNGDYGKCLKCGKQIGRQRLNIVPHARFCIECKESEEQQEANRR